MDAAFAGRGPALDRLRVLRSGRAAVIAACGLLEIAAASGVVAHAVFHQPTTAKYIVTVLAPLLLIAACLAADPLRFVTGAAIIAAPWNFVATVEGVQLAPLTVLLVLALALALFDMRSTLQPPTVTGSVVVVAVAMLVPAFVLGVDQGHYATWIGSTLVAGWLAFLIARRPGGLRFVLSMIAVAAALQGVIAVYEFARHVNLDLYSSSVGQAVTQSYFFNFGTLFRPDGTMSDPIALGDMLAVASPLALGLALSAKVWRERLWWAACAVMIAIGLVLSLSRASWIAVIVGMVVAVVALPPRWRLTAAAAVAGLLIAAGAIGLALGGHSLEARFNSITDPTAKVNRTSATDRLREQIWHSAYLLAESQPVVGIGFGNLEGELSEHLSAAPPGYHAHSVYLQFFAEAGIVGLLALLLIVGHAGTAVLSAFRSERLMMAAITGAMVAMLITWVTDTSPRYTSVSATLAFLLGAAMARRRGQRLRDQVT